MAPIRILNGCTLRVALLALVAALLLVFPPRIAHGAYALNLPTPASEIARQIYDLHTLVLWICAAILVVVFVPMAIALVRHRKAAGHAPAKFHENFRLEVAWTIVPVLILAGMAYPVSLSKLVNELVGARLGKGLTFSHWDQRPLSAVQMRYAADDVRYLPALRAELGRRIEARRQIDRGPSP